MMLRSLAVLLRQAGQAGGDRLLGFVDAQVGHLGQLVAVGGIEHREAGFALHPLPVDQGVGLQQRGVLEQGEWRSLHVHGALRGSVRRHRTAAAAGAQRSQPRSRA
jgi:hypothetical protein